MATFSIRTVFLITAAIATIYPIVRPSSSVAFVVWLAVASVIWGAAGLSVRDGKPHRWYFAALGLVPLLVAITDNLFVAVCDGWPDVTINASLPHDADTSTTTLYYVPLPQRDMLPYVLEHGIEIQEAVKVADVGQPVVLPTGYSYRCSQFGNTWGYACEYDMVVFLATLPDGTLTHGVVELPDRYDPRPMSIKWNHATEPSDAAERE